MRTGYVFCRTLVLVQLNDCEDLALLRQKAEVEACELLSRDSVRTSLLSCDNAHVPQLPLFASVIRGGTT